MGRNVVSRIELAKRVGLKRNQARLKESYWMSMCPFVNVKHKLSKYKRRYIGNHFAGIGSSATKSTKRTEMADVEFSEAVGLQSDSLASSVTMPIPRAQGFCAADLSFATRSSLHRSSSFVSPLLVGKKE